MTSAQTTWSYQCKAVDGSNNLLMSSCFDYSKSMSLYSFVQNHQSTYFNRKPKMKIIKIDLKYIFSMLRKAMEFGLKRLKYYSILMILTFILWSCTCVLICLTEVNDCMGNSQLNKKCCHYTNQFC